jgi:stearoyl-CoA desaturase (delta-9 desaturase)
MNASEGIMNSGTVSTLKYYLSRLHIPHFIILTSIPILSIYTLMYVPLLRPTMYLSIFWYLFTGLGITAGYHRLFAHRAYEAHPIAQFLLMVMGTGALEGSVKWWAGGHRVHHRYTDTRFDPYNSNGGFWYAHIGWMLIKPKPENQKYADIKDLRDNAWIEFQHKHYMILGPFVSLVVPTLIAGIFWGDWWGGYFWAGVVRQLFVHHSTFCVNSVAHYFGEQTFDDDRTPRDSVVTAFLTFGEGYHNFHHEFPNDYRNGIRTWDYDPTKWLIKLLNLAGLTYKLRVFPSNEIEKGKLHMKEKALEQIKQSVRYPVPIDQLPVMTLDEFKAEAKSNNGRSLVLMDFIIHDVSEFIPEHPGGQALIKSVVGADATKRFKGLTGVYKHSQAAHHLLSTFRVARLHEDDHAKILKSQESEAEAPIPGAPATISGKSSSASPTSQKSSKKHN